MQKWRALADTAPLRRLKSVGMNCGLEYTRFEPYVHGRRNTRYDHSVGVAEIIWRFTGDEKQAAAGLLHDVSTPVFAHVVDFLNGDALTQESTEAGTRQIIEESEDVQRALREMGLTTDDVCDYHIYPVADNPSPRLSADRLEYTLRNLTAFHICTPERAQRLYEDLIVDSNEYGEAELMFRTPDRAREFAQLALRTARLYVTDADRCAMQYLAELLARAIDRGVLRRDMLHSTEPQVIAALEAHPETAELWRRFCALSVVERSEVRPDGGGWRQIPAKKRFIDPLARGLGRVSAWDEAFGSDLEAFRRESQDVWVRARGSQTSDELDNQG